MVLYLLANTVIFARIIYKAKNEEHSFYAEAY